ncbi:hypothetical protein IGI04_013707, partial [Brassica rapa subsp. trilocularis]
KQSIVVGTEIRTVDFRLNKETRKTLISQRSRISARANDNLEKTVDLISSPRKSVAIITREYKGFGRRGRQRRIPNLKSSPPCSSPRTPYILAPRSHKNGDIPFFPIFTIIFKTSVFIRGNLTFILPCGPSVNQAVVYGLLIRKIVGWASSRVLGSKSVTTESMSESPLAVKYRPNLNRTTKYRLSEGNRHVSKSAADKLEYGNKTVDKPSSIDTRRPSMHTARSLRSDRARAKLGR